MGRLLGRSVGRCIFSSLTRVEESKSASPFMRCAVPPASSSCSVAPVSSDAQTMYELLPIVNQIWAAPLVIVLGTMLLVSVLGWAALVGVGFLCLMVPINYAWGQFFARLRNEKMSWVDQRVKLCLEVRSSSRANR